MDETLHYTKSQKTDLLGVNAVTFPAPVLATIIRFMKLKAQDFATGFI